jgi:hypothetical protein
MNIPQKIETELRVVAHGEILSVVEAQNVPEPSDEDALFRIAANTNSLEVKKNDLSSQPEGEGSNVSNG